MVRRESENGSGHGGLGCYLEGSSKLRRGRQLRTSGEQILMLAPPRITKTLQRRGPRLRRRARPFDHALIRAPAIFRAFKAAARSHRKANQQFARAAFTKIVVGFVKFDERVMQFAKRTLRGLVNALASEVDDLVAYLYSLGATK